MIKMPDSRDNEMLGTEDPAFTGKNPEVSEGLFMIAVVVVDDVSVVVYTLVCPGFVLVKVSIDTITTVTVVGAANSVTVTV